MLKEITDVAIDDKLTNFNQPELTTPTPVISSVPSANPAGTLFSLVQSKGFVGELIVPGLLSSVLVISNSACVAGSKAKSSMDTVLLAISVVSTQPGHTTSEAVPPVSSVSHVTVPSSFISLMLKPGEHVWDTRLCTWALFIWVAPTAPA